jgi:hypothetical protein
MEEVQGPFPEEIEVFFVVFHTRVRTWWVRAIPGRFKHVSVFAYAPNCSIWLFYEVSINGTRLILLPNGQHEETLSAITAESSVLKFKRLPTPNPVIRPGFWCVTAISHLLGLPSGALRPDALWRQLLREGAEIVIDQFV